MLLIHYYDPHSWLCGHIILYELKFILFIQLHLMDLCNFRKGTMVL